MQRYLMLLAFLAALLPSGDAEARRVPLETQIRAHGGLSLTNASFTPGFTLGLDTRLTRLLYMDVGGFGSLVDAVGDAESDEAADSYALRHAIYVTPGLRVPHRYGDGLNWDLIGRAGFGAVWAHDAKAERAPLVTDPAFTGGADLVLRWKKVGMRLGGKAFFWQSYAATDREDITVLRPMTSAEFLYQW
ncbi:MAG: hypothetical protein VX000_10980 [Myxococcota bacterium]|nr:hypothetical protein [Myxococcota bacterium]